MNEETEFDLFRENADYRQWVAELIAAGVLEESAHSFMRNVFHAGFRHGEMVGMFNEREKHSE